MKKITKNMKISEIENYPKVIEKLAKKGMFCLGCPLAINETLEQGAIVHGINPNKLVKELNKVLQKEKYGK